MEYKSRIFYVVSRQFPNQQFSITFIMFKFILAGTALIVTLKQGYCAPGLGHDGGGDFGIGGGIEHLPLDSGHGGGGSYGGGDGGGFDLGGHGGGGGGGGGGHGGSLEGSDYHHGVSVVSIPAGKPHTFDLTGGHDQGGKIYGGSFISAGAHGKTGGYAPIGHESSGGGGGGDIGSHYASVLYAGSHIEGAHVGGGGDSGGHGLEGFGGGLGGGFGGGLGGYEVVESGHH